MKRLILLIFFAAAIIFMSVFFISSSIASAQNSYTQSLAITTATPTATPTNTPTPTPTFDPTMDIEQHVLEEIALVRECFAVEEVVVEGNVYKHICVGPPAHSDNIIIERFADEAAASAEFAVRLADEDAASDSFRCFPTLIREVGYSTDYTWQVENWLVTIDSFHDTPYGAGGHVGLSSLVYETAIEEGMIARCAGEPEPTFTPTPTVTPTPSDTPTPTPTINPDSTATPAPTAIPTWTPTSSVDYPCPIPTRPPQPSIDDVTFDSSTTSQMTTIVVVGRYLVGNVQITGPTGTFQPVGPSGSAAKFDVNLVPNRSNVFTVLRRLTSVTVEDDCTYTSSYSWVTAEQIEIVQEGDSGQAGPTVTINQPNGAPGSVFVLEGGNFAPDREITVAITGIEQTFTVRTDADGVFVLLLLTDELALGTYELSLPTMSEASNAEGSPIAITLDDTLPRRERPAAVAEDAQQVNILDPASQNTPRVFLPYLQQ